MRLLVSLLAAGAVYLSSANARADFTITWFEHLHSSKGTEETIRTTMAVAGEKLHYMITYEGAEAGKPRHRNLDLTGDVKNAKGIADALAALDKIKVTPDLAATAATVDEQTGCLTRGKTKRCESSRDDVRTPGLKAFMDLSIAVQENIDDQRKAQQK